MPQREPLDDARLCAQIEAHLNAAYQIPGTRGGVRKVLWPQDAATGLMTGLVTWIDHLAMESGIESWDLSWASAATAVLKLRLRDAEHWTEIPLHPYQIGLDGIETLAGRVMLHAGSGDSSAGRGMFAH